MLKRIGLSVGELRVLRAEAFWSPKRRLLVHLHTRFSAATTIPTPSVSSAVATATLPTATESLPTATESLPTATESVRLLF